MRSDTEAPSPSTSIWCQCQQAVLLIAPFFFFILQLWYLIRLKMGLLFLPTKWMDEGWIQDKGSLSQWHIHISFEGAPLHMFSSSLCFFLSPRLLFVLVLLSHLSRHVEILHFKHAVLIMPATASLRHWGIFDVLHTDGAHAFPPPQVLTISQTSNCFLNMPVNHLPKCAPRE